MNTQVWPLPGKDMAESELDIKVGASCNDCLCSSETAIVQI